MLVNYLRSSSVGTLKFCQQQYYLNYCLGLENRAGPSATKGTIFHLVFELRALAGIAHREGKKFIEHDEFGKKSVAWAKDYTKTLPTCMKYIQRKDSHIDFKAKKITEKEIAKWCKNTLEKWPEYDPFYLNIKYAEYHFDLTLEDEWAGYELDFNGQHIKEQLRIVGTIDNIVDLGNNIYQIYDYKGLPIETPIPTKDGWTTMGEVKVGDVVFDRYGKQTKVIGKSKQKFKNCYKITFDDTSTVVCDDEHKWKLLDGSTVEIKDLKVKDQISTANPIECNYKELPIDPYVLGVWLGDGRNRGGEISSEDQFIFDEIRKRGYILGEDISSNDKDCEARTIYKLTKKLKELNVTHNKHIPDIYMRASYNQRLDLLRGLMDSDGSVNTHRKQCVFMNCTEQLSQDVKSLLLTLGQRPLLSRTEFVTKDNYLIIAFPVSFKPIKKLKPFLLPKKADKITSDWSRGKSYRRQITSIEQVEKKQTQCIMVDSPDHTFLCTENMIPTHNSGKMRQDFVTGEEKTLEYLRGDSQLLFYLYACKKIWPDKQFLMSLAFVNAGGIYTVVADDEMIQAAEQLIKDSMKKILDMKVPTVWDKNHYDWRCKYCCEYSKPAPYTKGKSVCQYFANEIIKDGIEKVTAKNIDFVKLKTYSSGGGKDETNRKIKNE